MTQRDASTKRRPVRLLVVEDDTARVDSFKVWLPADVRLVWARNGGQALGILNRDKGRVYAGILLDHDLPGQIVVRGGEQTTGTEVVEVLRRVVPRNTPILVHSMNRVEAPLVVEKLERDGYPVTRIRFRDLTAAHRAKSSRQSWS